MSLLNRFRASSAPVSQSAVAVLDDLEPPVETIPTYSQVAQVLDARPVQSVETIQRLRPELNGAGNGIRAAQESNAAAAEGFSSVNREWYLKTIDYDQARNVMSADSRGVVDLIAPRSRFSPIVGDDGAFLLADLETGANYRPTENALGQLAGWTETGLTLPKRLIGGDAEDVETLVAVMRNGWRKIASDKPLMLRLRSDGTLRAILSDGYRRIDNLWFLDVLESIVPGGRVSHLRGDGDAWFFNLLIPDSLRQEDDSQYGAMLAAGNSEIGTRAISTLPSVFRWICFNGNIWDQVEGVSYMRRIHRGDFSLDELRAEIAENLNRQIPLLNSGVDRFLSLRSIIAPKALPDLSVMGTILDSITGSAITRPMASTIMGELSGQRLESSRLTAFDIVNSITPAAQQFSPSLQESVERAAGELTAVWTPERWDSAFRNAKTFREKDARRVFTLDVAGQLSA